MAKGNTLFVREAVDTVKASLRMSSKYYIDGKTAYHIGASIKDAGKKCFGISLLEDPGMVADLLNRLRTV